MRVRHRRVLGNPAAIVIPSSVGALTIACVSIVLRWLPGRCPQWFGIITMALAGFPLTFNRGSRFKIAFVLPAVPWWKAIQLPSARMGMYDTELDGQVQNPARSGGGFRVLPKDSTPWQTVY